MDARATAALCRGAATSVEFDLAISSRDNGRSMTEGAFAMANTTRAFVLGLLALNILAGCKKSAGGPPPDFPATVVLAEAKRQPISETLALVGTLAANEIIEIKSETDGTVAEVLFEEGQQVKKGDLLLRLDESKLLASLAEAEANLKLS